MDFTASRSPLLAICGYPFRPDVRVPDVEAGRDAAIGTVAWARVVAHAEGRDDPGNVDLTGEDAKDCDAYYAAGVAWLKGQPARAGWRYEVKFAWSPSRDVARELPSGGELRDYSAKEGDEVCGSTDIAYMGGDVACVDDIKTGVTPLVQYIPQIRTLGLFVSRAFRTSRVRVRLVKLYKDKPAEEWVEELRRADLDALAVERREQLERAKVAQPRPGSHCVDMFCPARVACPEVPVAVAQLVPADALVKTPKFSWEFVSHDHDAAQLEMLRLVGKAVDDLKKVIKQRTPPSGVMLSDGRFLREGFHEETRYREAELIATIRELGAHAGLTDEDIDRTLLKCTYTFQKSEGLKVTKATKSKKRAA